VPEQKFDLLQIASTFATKLRARPSQIVGTEPLDPDLPGGLLDDGPDCPITQTLPYLAALADAAQEWPLFNSGRRHPGIDAVLDPDRDGHGPDASSLPFQIRQHPAPLPELDGLNIQRSEFLPAKGAADQQRQDHVVPLPFRARTVGDGQ